MRMEQTAIKTNRHAGWSEQENNLLWETADEAQQRGLPLKQVFERIAEQTGRRPNSIRNYYYAQVRQREGDERVSARFVPFEEQEVESLVEDVLRARARGQSVRSCLQEMSGGDHSLMLRYQNKYRSVLKNRPELIERTMSKLREEGVECPPPEVRARLHGTVEQGCGALCSAARETTDAELIRACDVLTRLILLGRTEGNNVVQMDRMHVRMDLYRLALDEKTRLVQELSEAADRLTVGVKEFLVRSPEEKEKALPAFCEQLAENLGTLEGKITAAENHPNE